MSRRRQLARERLEMVLLQLLLAYRLLVMVTGLILLLFAIAMLLLAPEAGLAILLAAILLLLLSNSYQFALYAARLGAWIGTICSQDD